MRTWFSRLLARAFPKKAQHKIAQPGGIPCQEVVELVTDYLEGALLPPKQAQFEAHIAGCEGCTNYLEQVRITINMLHNLAQSPAFPNTKEELLQVFRQWKDDQNKA